MDHLTWVWRRREDRQRPGFPEALALRIAVFMDEQGFSSEEDAVDDSAWHLLGLDGETVVACARLYVDEETRWHVGRIAVRRDHRGTGLGAAVMLATEQQAVTLGADALLLSAQVKARGFYEACGYQAVGDFYFDEYCPHIDMRKELLPR